MWYIYKKDDIVLNSRECPEYSYFTVKRMPPKPNKDGYISTLMADFTTEKVWYELVETFENASSIKRQKISTSCNEKIVNGFDCTLSDGNTYHFSLEETDQINLTNAIMSITMGATTYPYHADGKPCSLFSATDIQLVSTGATNHKLYHTTYCNHLYQWISRCETIEDLDAVYYGADLPDDLQESMNTILGVSNEEI